MNVCLPVDGSLAFPMICRSVQLQKAGLYHEHAAIPLLEYLFGSYTLENETAKSLVHFEEWRKAGHSPSVSKF